MPDMIRYPIETDPDALAEVAFTRLTALVPGWTPSPGSIESWLIEAIAWIAAEVRDVANDVPTSIFRWFGAKVAKLTPIDATKATVTSTWTASDVAGHTITAGTVVGLRRDGDTLVAFEVVSDVIIPPGGAVTATGAVLLVALEAGASGSGLTGAPVLIDSLGWVQSIALVGASTGGVDAESDDTYLNRLASELQLLTPRPILPRDFEILARRIPGVQRVLAIDGYNPLTLGYGNERMIAIAAIDASGAGVSAGIKSQIDALLQAQREVNFVVNVIDPTTTTINVAFTGTCWPGFDPIDVTARAVTAATAAVSPAGFGIPEFGDARDWIYTGLVRYLEVAEAINRTEGFRFITTLTLNGTTADVALTGPAPLPAPGTVTGSVTL